MNLHERYDSKYDHDDIEFDNMIEFEGFGWLHYLCQ